MREPAAWMVRAGPGRRVRELAPALRLGLAGVEPARWDPPGWLLPHQRGAARRLLAALRVFGGALLCDAVGLGKSFVALALAGRYRAATLVIPAALRAQWRDLAAGYGVTPRVVTHEALSRGARLAPAPLLVVDEAHRFRNPETRRYDALSRQIGGADLLLLTATPVVNRAADLTALLRLFLADHALAALGVPSLEAAAEGGDLDPLAHAVACLTVARSAETADSPAALPEVRGGRVIRPAPREGARLSKLVRDIRRLRFPTFGADAAPLLRQHLFARLASSPEACAESVRRHQAYLARAHDAARRGVELGRRAARTIFGPEDAGQLDLVFDTAPPLHAATGSLEAERRRLARLATLLTDVGANPKADACLRLLRRRAGRKTIVFTAARATARALAAALGWRRVAVVAGRRAEVASGRLAVEDAFALFAPRAQRRAAPPPQLRLDTLIATDVASEGLNLQDADAVVHYDLPWTPLGLEQRTGRARRLGSAHPAVRVWWFAPPRALERRLGLTTRIGRKATLQLALGTPSTACVGRASLVGGVLDRRERLLVGPVAPVGGQVAGGDGLPPLAVVRWRARRGEVFQILARDTRGLPVREVESVLARGDAGLAVGDGDLAWATARVQALAISAEAPARATRRLARLLADLARGAARERAARLLAVLDRAFQRVQGGLVIGAERELGELLSHPQAHDLAGWCARWPTRHPGLRDPEIIATVSPPALRTLG